MRRNLTALLFALGLASLSGPALAAVCAGTPALPDTERRTEYAGIVSQTGPFNVGFQLYGDSTDYGNWVSVWVNGVALTPVTDFIVTSPTGPLANLCRPISDAQVTFTVAQTGTIEIEGSQRPRRTSQVSENTGVTARTFNQVISTLTAELRERWDRQSRLVRSPPGETLAVLPAAATRANKFLTFDGSGNPALTSPTPGLGNVVGPPTSVVGNLALWNNTTGTLLKDGVVSVPTNPAADQVLLTTATATGSWASVPNCTGGALALAYATASHTFSCVGQQPTFDTVAAATAATIPVSGTGTIYIRGFLVAGDAGGGFWTRSVSMPVPTARFQSADGAWWSPSLANGVFPFEMFGGQCGGSAFDNTPAMNKYNSFITTNGQQRLRFQPCSYFHTTLPNAFAIVAPYFEGTGTNGTVLNRNVNGSAGIGFIQNSAASGVTIQNLEIVANTGTSVGDGIRWDASGSNGSSGSFLSNVTIAGLGTDNFQNMATIDGHLKTTGAIGSRDHNWIAVTIFGSATSAVNALSVEGFTWNGGGVYPAGGTGTAQILLDGLTAPMASNVVNINIAIGNDVQLNFCTRCILRSTGWSNVFNTGNTNRSGVAGFVIGTSNANWTNSNYLAF